MTSVGQPIRQLRIGETLKAVRTKQAAMTNDPLQLYLRNTPDADTSYFHQAWSTYSAAEFSLAIHKGLAWTVGDSFAVMIYEPADEAKGIVGKLVGRILSLYGSYFTPQVISEIQRRRRRECLSKFEKMVEETLGEKKKSMYYLALLMTRPEQQGRGYGSALVKLMTAFADTHGRESWLLSSNIKNTAFYNSLGFITKAQVAVGDQDPDWTGPPVVVSLMIREIPESKAQLGSTQIIPPEGTPK
ncbi:hypothetical protein BDY19DRAFT_340758 [Irpex rosettiformis]|uniref:Uncharacterized protein n=1 Tax=Irpex rosettiformis TaxID=378272 RepID=A0ACB8TXJ7_9APHY|nr:hypothetical protein BDY19DRAFT_340758 [Irpex rosettiformis]